MRNDLVASSTGLGEALAGFLRAHRLTPTLTAFIPGGMRDPADRRHWEVELKREISRQRRLLARATKDERAAFDAAVDALMGALPPGDAVHGSPGWALFATATGAVLRHPLQSAAAAAVHWMAGPYVSPCLATTSLPAAIVAIADRKHAKLYRLDGVTLMEIEAIHVEPRIDTGIHMGSMPRRGFHPGTRGGTQRDAADRALRDARDRHAADIAGRVAVLAGSDLDVITGGVATTASRVEAALPESFRHRVARATGTRMTDGAARVASAAGDALGALMTARQLAFATALLDAAGVRGHAVTGLPDALRALELRAVDHLLLSPTLFATMPETIERVVRDAVAEGAVVGVARPAVATLLDAKADGAVARLRFPVSATRRARPGRRAPRPKSAARG